MEPIRGGHKSGTAPACDPTPASTAGSAQGVNMEVVKETRGVADKADLVIQVCSHLLLSLFELTNSHRNEF